MVRAATGILLMPQRAVSWESDRAHQSLLSLWASLEITD